MNSMAPKWIQSGLGLCCLQSVLRSGKADSKVIVLRCCEVALGCFHGAKVGSKVGSEWDDMSSKMGSVVKKIPTWALWLESCFKSKKDWKVCSKSFAPMMARSFHLTGSGDRSDFSSKVGSSNGGSYFSLFRLGDGQDFKRLVSNSAKVEENVNRSTNICSTTCLPHKCKK